MRRVSRQQKKTHPPKQRQLGVRNYKSMTESIKQTIEVLQHLPEDEQDTVVRAIMDFASRYERTPSGE